MSNEASRAEKGTPQGPSTLAAALGADIATVPHAVLKQLFRHPLTDLGVERFLKDWRQAKGTA